jgi:hypothetical protein
VKKGGRSEVAGAYEENKEMKEEGETPHKEENREMTEEISLQGTGKYFKKWRTKCPSSFVT